MKDHCQIVFFGDVAVVTVATGTTDLFLAKCLLRLLHQDYSRILIDLQELRSIDSGRIGELLLYRKRAVNSGGDLKLLKPRGSIRQMLEMTHLDSVFEIYDSLAPALGSFSAPLAEAPVSAFRSAAHEAPTPIY